MNKIIPPSLCWSRDYRSKASELMLIFAVILFTGCNAVGEQADTEKAALQDAQKTNGPQAGDVKTLTIKGINVNFRYCPAGKFAMGSPKEEQREVISLIKERDSIDGKTKEDSVSLIESEKQHRVTVLQAFWMGETEVTQELYKAVMDDEPNKFKGNKLPVEQVAWNDCKDFVKALNELGVAPEGFRFALPTEPQWEYACRAGSTDRYCYGDGASRLKQYAWCADDSESKTHPVGTKKPNAWGLYDMHGNVEEWCQSWYGDYADSLHERARIERESIERELAEKDTPEKRRTAEREYNEREKRKEEERQAEIKRNLDESWAAKEKQMRQEFAEEWEKKLEEIEEGRKEEERKKEERKKEREASRDETAPVIGVTIALANPNYGMAVYNFERDIEYMKDRHYRLGIKLTDKEIQQILAEVSKEHGAPAIPDRENKPYWEAEYEIELGVWLYNRIETAIERVKAGNQLPPQVAYVSRGGSWGDYAENCRSAARDWNAPNDCSNRLGFRIALVVAEKDELWLGLDAESGLEAFKRRQERRAPPPPL